MVNLNNRGVIHPRWMDAGASVMRGFFNCVIEVLDPNSAENGKDFNPYEPTLIQTSVPTILFTGPAQMQVYRQSLTVDDVSGSVTQLRSVRFTTDIDGMNFPVRKGLIIHVTDCPRDRMVERYEFVVTSGLNSGLAFERTIEAESDMMARVPKV